MRTPRSRTRARALAALVAGALTCAGTAHAAIRPAGAKPASPHHAAAAHHSSHHHTAPHRPGARHSAPRRTTVHRQESPATSLVPDTFTGGGFDTCAAPSVATMSTWWGNSQFKAVGVYIGGVNRACPMGNLSANWVHHVSTQGWHLIPAYVGVQAPCVTAPHLSLMKASTVQAQATAAADDAATQAVSLGMAPGSAIYYDLENYRHKDASCKKTVLAFIDTWVRQLHTHGLLAGVYSSAGSGITDLAQAYNNPGWMAPDAVWIARWDKVASTSDPAVPASEWSQHQRIKQFAGGHKETHGPVSIDVDGNYVDGPVAIVH